MATQQGTIFGLAKKAECSCGCGDTVASCKCGPDCSCRKPGGSCYKAGNEKAGRCWSGYEPVPGSKPYTDGSCRPAGSKKTQKEVKKQAQHPDHGGLVMSQKQARVSGSPQQLDKAAAFLASLHPVQQLVFRKQAQAQVALHLVNMCKLAAEMNTYNVAGLQKAAAVGTHEQARLKYAALAIRYQQEKEANALLMGLLRGAMQMGGGLAGGLASAGRGVARGLGQAGGGVGRGALTMASSIAGPGGKNVKGLGDALASGVRGTAKGVSDATSAYAKFLKRNPRAGGAISAGLGAGAATAAPAVAGAYGKLQDAAKDVGSSVGSAAQETVNAGKEVGRGLRKVPENVRKSFK